MNSQKINYLTLAIFTLVSLFSMSTDTKAGTGCKLNPDPAPAGQVRQMCESDGCTGAPRHISDTTSVLSYCDYDIKREECFCIKYLHTWGTGDYHTYYDVTPPPSR